MLATAVSAQAAPTAPITPAVDATDPTAVLPLTGPVAVRALPTKNSALDINDTLAAQLQPSTKALSAANQELLSRNAQLQRQVNDLQTQVNVLVYESKGQLFLYGAFAVLISLLVGIFVSWLVFVRRERW
ncbi:hypothetical protein R0J89_03670 [Psychrobacter sp. SIMBA_152]